MSDQGIELVGIKHQFDGRVVLDDINLSVKPGEIVVVMGSSGGGKTTLLKCIGGLLTPTEGDVIICGIQSRKDPDGAREHIGFVFQYAALFDSMSVEENILFGAQRRRSMGKVEAKKTVDVLLKQVGLSGTEKMQPNELSGGMRKRVGLARALAIQPDVILFDEPTSGLDPVTAYAIDQLIVQTREHTGAACVVVSHDVTSVLRVADRVMFLHDGKAIFLGDPKEFVKTKDPDIRDLLDKSHAEVLDMPR